MLCRSEPRCDIAVLIQQIAHIDTFLYFCYDGIVVTPISPAIPIVLLVLSNIYSSVSVRAFPRRRLQVLDQWQCSDCKQLPRRNGIRQLG